MAQVSTNASHITDLRSHPRYPTQFDVIVTVAGPTGVASPVTVADISAWGIRIQCHQSMRVGMRVNLKANHFDVMATVVRATPGGYGLKLAREIKPLEIVRQNYAGLEHLRRLPR